MTKTNRYKNTNIQARRYKNTNIQARRHKNGRVYPENMNFSPEVIFINQSPLYKVIALFLRNKLVEIAELLLKLLLGVLGCVIAIALCVGIVFGLGWSISYIPYTGIPHNSDAYLNIGTVALFGLMLIGLLFICIYASIIGLNKWIRSNWRKAKCGERVSFLGD